ncbi:TPA: hypothetical protein ACIZOE_002041, partial [Streptococcus agalactiae]
LIETYSIGFIQLSKNVWLVSLSKHTEHTVGFDGITNLPNREAWNGSTRFHEKMRLFNFER